MKKITTLVALLITIFLFQNANAQSIGIGTSGFSAKFPLGEKWGTTLRLNPALNFGGKGTGGQYISPALFIGHTLKSSENASLYLALGLGSDLLLDETKTTDLMTNYKVIIPVGVNVFPFDDKRVSFTLEPDFILRQQNKTLYASFAGLIDLNFHFGK